MKNYNNEAELENCTSHPYSWGISFSMAGTTENCNSEG